uniref:Ig-like domain-containing protein n=1 Tax=Falco tinnunculus TaxID=100819 RepID=A0A8C4XPB9_FALTI
CGKTPVPRGCAQSALFVKGVRPNVLIFVVLIFLCSFGGGGRKPLLTFSVHLLEPPRFIQMPTSVVALQLSPTEVVKGLEATLECEVTGTPPFEVKWLKNNKEMFSSKKYNNVATLKLTSVDLSHRGRYTCQAKNESGVEKCFALLFVQGVYKV